MIKSKLNTNCKDKTTSQKWRNRTWNQDNENNSINSKNGKIESNSIEIVAEQFIEIERVLPVFIDKFAKQEIKFERVETKYRGVEFKAIVTCNTIKKANRKEEVLLHGPKFEVRYNEERFVLDLNDILTKAGNIFTNCLENAISCVAGARGSLPNLSQNLGPRVNGVNHLMNKIGSANDNLLEGSSFSSYLNRDNNSLPPNSDSYQSPELDGEDLISWLVDELAKIVN